MRIPKIIHYCWFGSKPISNLDLKCIESWKKFFPDYKLMFWNEKTFDLSKYTFTLQAYEKKYYAFVSDFVRAYALKKYGGIYLDTDLEVLSNFNELLDEKDVVLGFENKTFVGTAMMATVPNHFIFNEFLNYYKKRSFINAKGEIDITANPTILAKILKNNKIYLNGKKQFINGVQFYEREIFFPKKLAENKFKVTRETKTIHHFAGSWLTDRQKKRGQNIFWIEICRPILRKCKDFLSFVLGEGKTKNIENTIRNWLR